MIERGVGVMSYIVIINIAFSFVRLNYHNMLYDCFLYPDGGLFVLKYYVSCSYLQAPMIIKLSIQHWRS